MLEREEIMGTKKWNDGWMHQSEWARRDNWGLSKVHSKYSIFREVGGDFTLKAAYRVGVNSFSQTDKLKLQALLFTLVLLDLMHPFFLLPLKWLMHSQKS